MKLAKQLPNLYFNAGHLIHAQNSKVTGDDVVYQLLGNRTATIRWDRTRRPAQESVSKTDEVLLLGALGILTEDDAPSVMSLVSQEAEREMASTFEAPPAISQPPAQPVATSLPIASVNPSTNGASSMKQSPQLRQLAKLLPKWKLLPSRHL